MTDLAQINFVNAQASDRLAFHDILRVTFVAPTHWWLSQAEESMAFGDGLDNLYSSEQLSVVPISPDPFVQNMLTATIDFLYPSTNTKSVADVINELLMGSKLWLPGSPPLVDITRVEKVVGEGADAPGSQQAWEDAFGPDAGTDRSAADTAALAERAKQKSWLQELEDTLGTAGKVVVVAAAAGLGYAIYRKVKDL